jgi:hypothetical protein
MKKFLLLVFLISGYHLKTSSQPKSQLQIDSTVVKFGFNNSPKTLRHADSIDFKRFLNNPPIHNYQLDPKLADKDVQFGHLSNAKIRTPYSCDNMPIIHPQGYFPMPVYKPDSTVNYTLLIKKIAKNPCIP